MNMRYLITTTLLLLITANTQAREPLRILDRGMDGNKRYYTVQCPNGKRASVVQTFNFSPNENKISQEVLRARINLSQKPIKVIKVCIVNSNRGKEECRGYWDLDQAAQASCR